MTLPARNLLAALLACLLCLGSAAGGAQAASGNARGRAPRPVLVSVLASGGYRALPVTGASVRVLRGERTIAWGRTGSRGLALARPRGPVSGTLRVVVSGGRIGGKRFDGQMAAVVHGYRWPQAVHVDSVTTLVARYQRRHPKLPLAGVERLARRFLDLPSSYVVGLGGRGNAPFDGRRYLAVARSSGGYDRFTGRLARQLGKPKAHRSFAHDAPPPIDVGWARVAELGAEAGSGLEDVGKAVSTGAGFFSVLTKTTQVLEFANAVKTLAGVGSNTATKAEIEEIDRQLQQIEQSLSVIERGLSELEREVTEGAYANLATAEGANLAKVESLEETLHEATKLAAQGECTSEARAATATCREVRELLTGPEGFVEHFAHSELHEPSGLNAFAFAIGGEVIPGAPSDQHAGLVQYASRTTTDAQDQSFYTNAQSARAVSAAVSWITAYAEALVAAPAYWGLTGVPQRNFESNVEQVTAAARAMPKLMPALVPEGTTLEMAHGQMYATDAGAEGAGLWNWFQGGGFEYEPEENQWVLAGEPGKRVTAITTENTPAVPYSNWQPLGATQLAQLLAAPTPKPGQLPGEALLEQAGFAWQYLIPEGYPNSPGLQLEYVIAGPGYGGCARYGPGECFWPIWISPSLIGNMHFGSDAHEYRQGTFETHKFLDIEWAGLSLYGYDNEGQIYGPVSPSSIPTRFWRPVGGECFYYSTAESPPPGASGCPY